MLQAIDAPGWRVCETFLEEVARLRDWRGKERWEGDEDGRVGWEEWAQGEIYWGAGSPGAHEDGLVGNADEQSDFG